MICVKDRGKMVSIELTHKIIQAAKTGKVDDVVYVDGALLVEGDWNTFYLYKLHMKEGKGWNFWTDGY